MPAPAHRKRATDSETSAAFLGVSNSARGFQWRERLAPGQRNTALAISQRHGVPELLGRVLAASFRQGAPLVFSQGHFGGFAA